MHSTDGRHGEHFCEKFDGGCGASGPLVQIFQQSDGAIVVVIAEAQTTHLQGGLEPEPLVRRALLPQ